MHMHVLIKSIACSQLSLHQSHKSHSWTLTLSQQLHFAQSACPLHVAQPALLLAVGQMQLLVSQAGAWLYLPGSSLAFCSQQCSASAGILGLDQTAYDDLRSEWDLHSMGELVLDMGDFNGHVDKRIEGYEGVHGGNGIGERNVEGKMLLEFCDEKELCVANTWFKKEEKRKMTYSAVGNGTEIDFVLVRKGNRNYLRDVKVIPGELHHRLVVTDLVKKVKKVVRKEAIERRKV